MTDLIKSQSASKDIKSAKEVGLSSFEEQKIWLKIEKYGKIKSIGKAILVELLNQNRLYINLSEVDDRDFKVSQEDKRLNELFFGKDWK